MMKNGDVVKERSKCWDGSVLMRVVYSDGGRREAGFKGDASDCVCRAIANVTGSPYSEHYAGLNEFAKSERPRKGKRRSACRTGVHKSTIRKYMAHLGFDWTPTMQVGTGCSVHLVENELPSGALVVSLSKHLTCVINHVIYDTFDPQRATIAKTDGQTRIVHRCVYGYWAMAKARPSTPSCPAD
jgi:hypothetical protein